MAFFWLFVKKNFTYTEKKLMFRYVTALMLFLAFPLSAHACQCIEQSREVLLNSADVVFTGVVDRVTSENGISRALVRVHDKEKSERYVLRPFVTLPSQEEISCGVMFEEGVAYEIFATIDADGDLQTTLCSGTKEISSDFTSEEIVQPSVLAIPWRGVGYVSVGVLLAIMVFLFQKRSRK